MIRILEWLCATRVLSGVARAILNRGSQLRKQRRIERFRSFQGGYEARQTEE